MQSIISIVSGKGGVGKSVLAVNLAETLVASGRAVALVDADLGQTACATLLNETPRRSASEAHEDPRSCWHPCGSGLTLVQGVTDPPDSDGTRRAALQALDAQVDALAEVHDVVLIDAPAGADDTVLWTLKRADVAALVIADEPTSIADAYRLAKRVWQSNPAFPFGTVVNFAETDAHGRDVWNRFGLITRRFMGNGSFYLGSVPFSTDVRRSVAAQRPFVRDHEGLSATLGAIATAAESYAHHARQGLSLQ